MLLRRKDCSSIKHDPTQSSFATLYLRYASRESGIHEVRRRIVQQSVSVSKITAKSSFFEARTSVDHQSKESEECGEARGDSNSYRGTEEFGETRSGNMDFRIQDLPHSTVQKQDDIRQIASR